MAAKKSPEKQAEEYNRELAKLSEAPEKLQKEQAEALGAGREEAKDRVDKKPEKSSGGKPPENDTPSALALKAVGDLNGEDLDDPHEGLEHGEAYQAEKRKHRWG